jgi:hypothetical protein
MTFFVVWAGFPQKFGLQVTAITILQMLKIKGVSFNYTFLLCGEQFPSLPLKPALLKCTSLPFSIP